MDTVIAGLKSSFLLRTLPAETIAREMEKRIPERFLEANRKAFETGYRIGQESQSI